jgi:hypothetical protein
MSDTTTSSNPLPGIGLSADALIAMLKDTLTNDLIPGAKDRGKVRLFIHGCLTLWSVIEKHKG